MPTITDTYADSLEILVKDIFHMFRTVHPPINRPSGSTPNSMRYRLKIKDILSDKTPATSPLRWTMHPTVMCEIVIVNHALAVLITRF